MSDHDIQISQFEQIPTCAFRNENISYAAAGVFSTLISFKEEINIISNYDVIRSHMRGRPSDGEIQTYLNQLEKEGYITYETVTIKKNGRSQLRIAIKICSDLETKYRHLWPRR